MKRSILLISSIAALSGCTTNLSEIQSSDLIGSWECVEYVIEENGDISRGLYANSSDGLTYYFDKPSTTGYMWVEIYENGQLKNTTNNYEYVVDGDSLRLVGLSGVSNNVLSSAYEIVDVKKDELTLCWYSELPSKHEKKTVLMHKK